MGNKNKDDTCIVTGEKILLVSAGNKFLELFSYNHYFSHCIHHLFLALTITPHAVPVYRKHLHTEAKNPSSYRRQEKC